MLQRVALVLLTVLTLKITARHFPCSPGTRTNDHVLWCDATVASGDKYSCKGADKGDSPDEHQVADWNRIGKDLFEFGAARHPGSSSCTLSYLACVCVLITSRSSPLGTRTGTPCGDGGYGFVFRIECNADQWLVGNVNGDDKWYYLKSTDDCT